MKTGKLYRPFAVDLESIYNGCIARTLRPTLDGISINAGFCLQLAILQGQNGV
jgi:hypothetical protein